MVRLTELALLACCVSQRFPHQSSGGNIFVSGLRPISIESYHVYQDCRICHSQPIIAILRGESISIYSTQIIQCIGFNAFRLRRLRISLPAAFARLPSSPKRSLSVPSTPSACSGKPTHPTPVERHGALFSSSRRRADGRRAIHLPLRWIKSRAMSAGVMPLIRLAWARLSGPDADAAFRGPRPATGRSGEKSKSLGIRLSCKPLLAGDLDLLPLDVAGVLHVEHHLLAGGRRDGGQRGRSADDVLPGGLGPAEQLLQADIRPRAGPASTSIAGRFPLLWPPAAASARRRPGPAAWPSGVNRRSALSCRSSSRYSARLVNMRYGSSTPRVTRSSINTPM